jgi:hypothetical protein
MAKKNEKELAKRRDAAREAGYQAAKRHEALEPVESYSVLLSNWPKGADPVGWGFVTQSGRMVLNEYQDGEPADWAWAITHLMLHLGLGHLDLGMVQEAGCTHPSDGLDAAYRAACCTVAHRFAVELRLGKPFLDLPPLPPGDEHALARRWRVEGIPADLRGLGVNGNDDCMVLDPDDDWSGDQSDSFWGDRLAVGLARAAENALRRAAGARGGDRGRDGPWGRALDWFVNSYPLLGALATGLEIVADEEIAQGWGISIAAVSPEHGEIYINPNASLSSDEWRFVLAHEMLHAALRHDRRVEGRDPELFNVACDFVINGWLVAMGVGALPEGLLFDQRLDGLSAESVYDTLATDLRRARKIGQGKRGRTSNSGPPGVTHGARGVGDLLGDWLTEPAAESRRSSRRKPPAAPALPWDRQARKQTVDLDEFYRRALTAGLSYHDGERGLVPSGLVEEIKALNHPPLDWDARLARWFDEHVRTPEPRRSYARASRRQSSTPDIPRPGRVRPEDLERRCTFGVVLDTSGSMDARLLGKALGAIASYATARDVPAARVVYCDAAAYDAGFLPVEEIAG